MPKTVMEIVEAYFFKQLEKRRRQEQKAQAVQQQGEPAPPVAAVNESPVAESPVTVKATESSAKAFDSVPLPGETVTEAED